MAEATRVITLSDLANVLLICVLDGPVEVLPAAAAVLPGIVVVDGAAAAEVGVAAEDDVVVLVVGGGHFFFAAAGAEGAGHFGLTNVSGFLATGSPVINLDARHATVLAVAADKFHVHAVDVCVLDGPGVAATGEVEAGVADARLTGDFGVVVVGCGEVDRDA